jgi:hypothetical protein
MDPQTYEDKKPEMKYAGPTTIVPGPQTTEVVRKLCEMEKRIFYYWGMPGEIYIAISPYKFEDFRKGLPEAFRDLEWRDTPYVGENNEGQNNCEIDGTARPYDAGNDSELG